MDYVTDTHAFLWHLSDDAHLSETARNVFARAERGKTTIAVPTIVLGELLYIYEKQGAKDRFMEGIRRVGEGVNFPAYPLDIPVVKELARLDRLQELHDRIIVATARVLGPRSSPGTGGYGRAGL